MLYFRQAQSPLLRQNNKKKYAYIQVAIKFGILDQTVNILFSFTTKVQIS